MHLIHHNGIDHFEFSALSAQPGFFHGVFLRYVANGQHKTEPFNLGMIPGAVEKDVRTNRKRMTAAFGTGVRSVYGRQIHGKEVAVLKSRRKRKPSESFDPISLQGDALVTDMSGFALVVIVADCQPVLIIDPVRRVVGNVHSGWRGSIQNVIGATIGCMEAEFNCRPKDLICGIGPSLGPCCAEFINYKNEIPEPFWKYRHAAFHFDFWRASMDQLTDAGVKPGNITISGICTRCNPHLFYSYRGDRNTGRFAAVVGIVPGQGSRQ